jgi:hypothetical protein
LGKIKFVDFSARYVVQLMHDGPIGVRGSALDHHYELLFADLWTPGAGWYRYFGSEPPLPYPDAPALAQATLFIAYCTALPWRALSRCAYCTTGGHRRLVI